MRDNSLVLADNPLPIEKSVLDCKQQCSFALHGCYDAIRCYILKSNGNPEDVDDNIQETYIALVQKWEAIEGWPQNSMRYYIFGISRNLWLKEIKRRSTEAKCLVEYLYETELSIVDNKEIIELKSHLILRNIRKMNAEARQIFKYIKKGLKNKEVAEKLGYNLETYKKRKAAYIHAFLSIIKKDPLYFVLIQLESEKS